MRIIDVFPPGLNLRVKHSLYPRLGGKEFETYCPIIQNNPEELVVFCKNELNQIDYKQIINEAYIVKGYLKSSLKLYNEKYRSFLEVQKLIQERLRFINSELRKGRNEIFSRERFELREDFNLCIEEIKKIKKMIINTNKIYTKLYLDGVGLWSLGVVPPIDLTLNFN